MYNAGRLFVYSLLGIGFGLLGQSVVLAGFQQFVSLGTGLAILAFLLLGLCGVANPFAKASFTIRRVFRRCLADRSQARQYRELAGPGSSSPRYATSSRRR